MMKRMFVALVAVLFAVTLAGPSVAQQPAPAGPPPVVKDLVEKTKGSIKTASADEVKSAAEKKSKSILLDVRTTGEYAAGHLPGAVNVDRGLLEFTVWNVLKDQHADIIVYCRTGARATLATKTLADLGFKNVRLAGIHYEPWVKAGNPVAR